MKAVYKSCEEFIAAQKKTLFFVLSPIFTLLFTMECTTKGQQTFHLFYMNHILRLFLVRVVCLILSSLQLFPLLVLTDSLKKRSCVGMNDTLLRPVSSISCFV